MLRLYQSFVGLDPGRASLLCVGRTGARNALLLAHARTHDLDVQSYLPGFSGIAAALCLGMVVGPIARLELLPVENNQPQGHDPLIEAQTAARQSMDLTFKDGETLPVSPRKLRVFLQGH